MTAKIFQEQAHKNSMQVKTKAMHRSGEYLLLSAAFFHESLFRVIPSYLNCFDSNFVSSHYRTQFHYTINKLKPK